MDFLQDPGGLLLSPTLPVNYYNVNPRKNVVVIGIHSIMTHPCGFAHMIPGNQKRKQCSMYGMFTYMTS